MSSEEEVNVSEEEQKDSNTSAAVIPSASMLAGTYDGEYQHGRFHGRGTYTMGNTKYVGGFVDGQFHGEGTLTVSNGEYKGFWKHGKLVEGGLVFKDGLQHLKIGYKYWEYCSRYDRRFYAEIKDGIQIGDTLRDFTSHPHANDLPKDCYDTIDGYYDAKKHAVYDYKTQDLIRTPNQEEIEFILTYCRVGK